MTSERDPVTAQPVDSPYRRLQRFRAEAVQASGGSSGEGVRHLVRRLLPQVAPQSIVDVGAGTGRLLDELLQRFPAADMAGIDYLERPQGLTSSVEWMQMDLNQEVCFESKFDLVICSETIEHLENPRKLMRDLVSLMNPDGELIVTTPNQECIRSLAALLVEGQFAHFRGASYPAHITSLLREDFRNMCQEVALAQPEFRYSDSGGLPKFPSVSWQQVSLGMLRGRLFSDNLGFRVRRLHSHGV